VAEVLDALPAEPLTLEAVRAADRFARERANQAVAQRSTLA
jgi:hypothetical protein